jgi:hypothetical protein
MLISTLWYLGYRFEKHNSLVTNFNYFEKFSQKKTIENLTENKNYCANPTKSFHRFTFSKIVHIKNVALYLKTAGRKNCQIFRNIFRKFLENDQIRNKPLSSWKQEPCFPKNV